MQFSTKFIINDINKILAKRGLEERGRVQKFIDSEMLRLTEPYVPMDSGALKASGITASRVGSGEIKYSTPYARRQYWENKGNGLRGKQWFERSKSANKTHILKGARAMAGGK